MDQLKPPNSLDFEGNLAEIWRTWIQKFDLYLIATGIAEKSDKVKCATFLHVAGDDAIKVFNTMDFDDDVDDFEVLKEKFREYCEPRKNITYLRHMFFTRAQGPNETIDAYVTDLKNKAKDCEFGRLNDDLIKDRIVCGVNNDTVRARLLRETDLNLAKAVDICRANEITQSHLKVLHEEAEVAVNKITKTKSARQVNIKHTRKEKYECTRCGYVHEPRKCPAYGKICNECSRKNHFSRMCKTPQKKDKQTRFEKKVHEIEQEDAELFIGTIEIEQSEEKASKWLPQMYTVSTMESETKKWTQEFSINNSLLTFKLDTGAECNVLSFKDFEKTSNKTTTLKKSNCTLVTYSGHTMETKGKVWLKCGYKDTEFDLEFQIVEEDSPAILGREACSKLGLIKRVYKVENKNQTDILSEYQDVFTGLGCVPGLHHIQLNPDVAPVIHAPRKVPIALKEKVRMELKRMEDLGVIVKQTEPTDWVNSMVTVLKPEKLRICIDPQDLNKAIKREHYPLRTIEEIVAEMPNAKVFLVLDANHGFWQVQLDEVSSKLCTFNTPFGRYPFLRLPFGIVSAPEVFQKCIAQRLEGLDGVVNIVDDILVWGEDMEQHDKRLRKLLDRIRDINLKLNKTKCKIRMTEVSYVGHILTAEGLKPDNGKVRAIQNMPEPQDKAALMRFLGLLQYLSKFIPNMSDLSAPLRKLLEGDVAWHWETEQQKSFERLKSLVSNTPVLKYFDVNKEIMLSVDASAEGLGAVLLQEGHPVAFGSRSLTECQKRYAQIEKELLAIVYGCEKFHQYVYGKTVQVETDHKPLETVFKKSLQKAPPRLQRMLMRLQLYDIRVSYKPGKELYIADTLSRAYLKEQVESLLEDELQVHTLSVCLPVSKEKQETFRTATIQDAELQQVVNVVQSGWPDDIREVPADIRKYWTYREELTCSDG
ncbi:retrotransposon-like family member retr-1 [Labeo rohita]|uniref:ribonuclease H n=1 Tax=Labeo rohita TaxID=84645 RepID=A0A498LST2_LABRO|nr:retrotransposon-like family member retr-1 [Labeo rohita]